jgi:transposase
MLSESGPGVIYLACGATDMRKSIDSLAALVTHAFDLDPFSDAWFVFCNRSKDKLKLLRWDHNGFWLYYRRLEKGRFDWPLNEPTPARDTAGLSPPRKSQTITRRQLGWLLDGLSLESHQGHKEVKARIIL